MGENFIEIFPSVLEFFLNMLEFIALVISVSTFFILMVNKFSRALKVILGPCGLGPFRRLRVLFICRKSQIKKRAFLEYAILRTKGCTVVGSEWGTIINGFKNFYTEVEQGELTYNLPNNTLLIGREFSAAAQRYFDYFNQDKVRKAYGLHDGPVGWVIKLNIEEAYATPTCLLTGLLSQYDENWEEFIKRYVSTAYMTEKDADSNGVLVNELYFTFAWLLWGPSYELEYQNYWAGLCQLSYGDESNSVPAVADRETDVAERLKARFMENDERRYGALVSAQVTLYDKKSFYERLYAEINPENAYFYNKAKDGELSFAVKIDNFAPCLNYKAKKYYSTAYVWVLFELESDGYEFRPEKSVAFFEHANLANKITYRFLIETLVDKCIKHFRTIFADPANADRKYRFVCGMNQRIENYCIERFKKEIASDSETGKLLKGRIIFERKYAPADVFAAYDTFFSARRKPVFEEVRCDDRQSLSDLGLFYTNIYMDNFPDENERETFDNLLGYLKAAESATDYRYHIVLAKDEAGTIIGGCIFDYFKKTNTGVIEFLAVRTDLQSAGIGTLIYEHTRTVLNADAFAEGKVAPDYLCCEIDSPEHSKADVKKYLYFWNKNGFMKIGFDYLQPALSRGKERVTGLWLTLAPRSGQKKSVPKQLVLDILGDYMRYAMGIAEPEKNEEYIAMKAQTEGRETLSLEKLI